MAIDLKKISMQVLNNIKSWANEDQPIYKMYKRGAKNLSDVELLAIILQHGTIHQNAVELARSLLNAAQNNLQKFSKLSVADILGLKIKGIGKKSAERLVLELKDKLAKLPMQMSGGSTFSKSTPHQDAIQALVSLGIQKAVAEKAIDKVIQSEGADVSLEILIKQALKNC